MTPRPAIVLQARSGSTRLPRKVLAEIAGRSILAHCIERLRGDGTIPVVLATTTLAEDDELAREGERMDITVVRGAADDVLARFAQAVTELGLTELVRATADNPAVDMASPRRVLELRRRTGADHVVEYGMPYGTTVEAVSATALLQAATLADDPADREHVTAFIRRTPQFTALQMIGPAAVRRSSLRLTVDTEDDLQWVRRVFDLAESEGSAPVPLATLIAAADRLKQFVPTDTQSGVRGAR